MSDDEVERFEITDYDLDNEFNIKRGKKLTKEQRIYGIWADESSGEDETTTSHRAQFKSTKKSYGYAGPINFVSAGIQQAGKPPPKEEKKSNEEEEDEAPNFKSSSDSSDDDNRVIQRSFDGLQTEDIAGMRKHRPKIETSLMQRGVGSWEKYTKGIGAKLLLQMGYEPGKGLGKELQGISAPIVAKLRKGRGAIGAYGPEESAKIADVKPEKKKEEGGKLSRWRKGDGGGKKRYVYKTIDEVIEERLGSNIPIDSAFAKVKVIDMTGPQKRVLSGYHAISRQQRPADEWENRKDLKFSNFTLPELLHNLNLLVDLCEQDIVSNDRKYKVASDRIVSLQHEATSLEKACRLEEAEINKLEGLLDTIETLSSNLENLYNSGRSFKKFKESIGVDFKTYEIAELAVSLISEPLKKELESWNPLEDPEEPLKLIYMWKEVVEDVLEVRKSSLANPEPFGKLLWHAWLPSVRNAISEWNARQPEPLLQFIDCWKPVLPLWLLEHLLESLILPKITHYVQEWDPMTDTIPIHAWIHPWLPYLEDNLQRIVFPVIRQKLSVALTAWHPSDQSARLMLLPWAPVFNLGEMNAFLVRYILPKLQQTLDEFIINPQHQVLDEHWKWVMNWMDLMPLPSMASLFEKHFFPKWLQVLTMWLNHRPNYEQVSNWYLGWKDLFPESLQKQPVVKEQFRQALELMNRAVGGVVVESYANTPEPSRYHQAKSEAILLGAQASITSYKQLFAQKCEEKGILFVPLPNKTHEGKQVYRCGSVQVYIDRNVVFVSQNNGATWVPQSFQTALMSSQM